MRPIGKNIVIKTVEEEIKTKSGILLSAEDTNQLRYKKGEVVVVGSDVTVINNGFSTTREQDILCLSKTSLTPSSKKRMLCLFYKFIHLNNHLFIRVIFVGDITSK